jgi:hypothetical protein
MHELQRITDNMKRKGATDAQIRSTVNSYLTEKKRKTTAQGKTIN